MKNLIRKILKENDWDWATQASSTISGEELEDFIRNNDLTEIPDHIKHVGGNLNLYNTPIKSLGNLETFGGHLDLYGTQIKSLENLESVDGNLDLRNSQIKSLGNLESVGGYLDLSNTTISKKYSEQEIRNMVNVGGNIYL